MTPDEVHKLAREAGAEYELIGDDEEPEDGGLLFLDQSRIGGPPSFPSLERFAALVEAAAMEKAAKDGETQIVWVLEMLVAARLIAPETAKTAVGIWRDASPAIRAASPPQ